MVEDFDFNGDLQILLEDFDITWSDIDGVIQELNTTQQSFCEVLLGGLFSRESMNRAVNGHRLIPSLPTKFILVFCLKNRIHLLPNLKKKHLKMSDV